MGDHHLSGQSVRTIIGPWLPVRKNCSLWSEGISEKKSLYPPCIIMNHHKQMIHCESLLVITRGYPRKKTYYESLLVITRGYPRLKKTKTSSAKVPNHSLSCPRQWRWWPLPSSRRSGILENAGWMSSKSLENGGKMLGKWWENDGLMNSNQ